MKKKFWLAVLILIMIFLGILILYLNDNTNKNLNQNNKNSKEKQSPPLENPFYTNKTQESNLKLKNETKKSNLKNTLEKEKLPEDLYEQACGFYFQTYGICAGYCPSGKCVQEGKSCYCKKEN